jgi:putative multiple sugar transport system ATP-binding protein
MKVADRITVIRDGKTVDTMDKAEVTEDRIIKAMVGRDLARPLSRRASRHRRHAASR